MSRGPTFGSSGGGSNPGGLSDKEQSVGAPQDPTSKQTPIGTETSRSDHTGVSDEPGGKDAPYEPSNVTIDKIELIHPQGTLDLNSALATITITESMFSPSITCRVEVLDASEKLAELDLDGTEELRVGFHSEKNREIDHIFNVYRVEVYPDDTSGAKGKAYQLFGISKEFMTQATMDINRTMTGNISNFVNIVFQEVKKKTGTKRRLVDRHFTTGDVVLNIPGMTPFETMSMLQKRAYNSKFSSSLFTFYEDFRGYNFINLEQAIAEGRDDPIKYQYSPGGQITDQKNVQGQYTINQISFPLGKDVLSKIKSGAYASQVAEIDILNQKVDRTILTVKENFKDFYHLDKPAISYDKTEVIDKHLNFINSTKWVNKFVDGRRHKENNFGPLITRRKFYNDSLGQLKMTCVVPGNSDLGVGMVMDLSMIETGANKDDPDQEKKISGKYLITEVNHQIIKGAYNCTMACHKSSYRANVTRIEDYVVGKR